MTATKVKKKATKKKRSRLLYRRWRRERAPAAALTLGTTLPCHVDAFGADGGPLASGALSFTHVPGDEDAPFGSLASRGHVLVSLRSRDGSGCMAVVNNETLIGAVAPLIIGTEAADLLMGRLFR